MEDEMVDGGDEEQRRIWGRRRWETEEEMGDRGGDGGQRRRWGTEEREYREKMGREREGREKGGRTEDHSKDKFGSLRLVDMSNRCIEPYH